MKTTGLFVLAVTMGLLLWGATIHAQAPSAASLHGRVLKAGGQPVAAAIVSLKKNGASQPSLTLTSAQGTYSFPRLDMGADYELRAEHEILTSLVRTVRAANSEAIAIDLTVDAPIQFADIAARAGLNFTLRNGATGHFYQPEIMLGGVAALDYNNDGCMDIFFVNGAEYPSLTKTGPEYYNRLYRNNCDRTFTDVTGKAGLAGEGYSMGVAAGDYDNDGLVDIFVTGLTRNTLYHNRGDGSFEDVTAKLGNRVPDSKYGRMWSVSAGWFDYDNDGYLDLFVTNYVTWEPGAKFGCTDGGKPYYCHPSAYTGLPNQLFHNNRNGTFTDVSESSGIRRSVGKGMGLVFGDFNGDGLPDVFVANDSVPNFLFENLGNGGFKEVAVATGVAYSFHGKAIGGMGADFRDFDDDGRDDIVLDGIYFDTFPLYRNLGKPKFFDDQTALSGLAEATHGLTGWGLGMYDLDNDGRKDLFFATSHFPGSEPYVRTDAAIPNHVFRNGGNGLFHDVSIGAGKDFQNPALHHGAAFADFDGDGRVDVVVTSVNSPVKLLRNTSPATHWIALRLVGTRSNRDGLGARVRVTLPSGALQHNQATTSVGYASSSEPLVHFGLGPYQTVQEIEVRWPSGRVQVLGRLAGDRVIDVREPQ